VSGRRIAKGIFEDRHGFELRWRDAGQTRTKHFPLDTPLQTLKDRRATYQKQARTPRPDESGSFPRDAVRFLAGRKRLASFKSDRAHLRPWIHRFKKLSRWAVTSDLIQKTLDGWAAAGYSARTLRHRRRVLRQMYAKLDADAKNPCAGVTVPTPGLIRKPHISDALINAVALQLRKQEIAGRLWDAKTRARFLVLALIGVRPAQLRRSLPVDLNVAERLWVFQPAKGDNGMVAYLNDEQLGAAQLFVTAKAWGDYDGRSFVKTLQRNGWPKGVRPYNARHTVGQTLRRRGADLGDVQDHLGHKSPTTTRQFYLEPDLERLKATSERLAGRIDPTALLHPSPTMRRKRKSTKDETRPQFAHRADGPTDGLRAASIAKKV
jgi:integrase